MSQTAEPSHVQLCLCNPNTARNAESSLPAVESSLLLLCGGERGTWKSKGQVVKTDDEANDKWGSRFCFNFGSDSGFVLMPSDSISPDSDLVRMWTAWVREDETLLPTAQARHTDLQWW